MGERFEVAVLASFGWGVASILLSPCHLSSIPLVVGYISSQPDLQQSRPVLISLVFGIGILITIAIIGALTAAAGRMMGDVGPWGNIIVAGVFVVVGLHLMDILHLSWSRFLPKSSMPRGWKGALLLGLIFGIGLGPCTFAYMAPVLGIVFSLASTNLAQGLSLMAAFGIGHCVLIVAAGGAAGIVQKYLKWTGKSTGATWLRRLAGSCVLLGGAYYVYLVF